MLFPEPEASCKTTAVLFPEPEATNKTTTVVSGGGKVAAAVTVRGALPKITALRSELAKLSTFEIRHLDNLDVYLHAWLRANALFFGAALPPEGFTALVAKVTSYRDTFASDAEALARRGLIGAEALASLKGRWVTITVMVEEALATGVPTLMIDIKGDLPNLLLDFPGFDPADSLPWVESNALSEEKTIEQIDAEQTECRKGALAAWNIGEAELRRYHDNTSFRVITPGSSAGELLHVLSSLERLSARWDVDPEAARDALSAAVFLVLRLLGRDPDPAKSREHVLLSVLAEQHLRRDEPAPLSALLEDLAQPPQEPCTTMVRDARCSRARGSDAAATTVGHVVSAWSHDAQQNPPGEAGSLRKRGRRRAKRGGELRGVPC